MPDGFYHSHFNSYSKNQLFIERRGAEAPDLAA